MQMGILKLVVFLVDMAPCDILCLVLGWKWSSRSSVCLATEVKVGMATLIQHIKRGQRSTAVTSTERGTRRQAAELGLKTRWMVGKTLPSNSETLQHVLGGCHRFLMAAMLYN